MKTLRLALGGFLMCAGLAGCGNNTPTAAPEMARPRFDNGMMAGSGNRTETTGAQSATPCGTCNSSTVDTTTAPALLSGETAKQ
jgi:hypothetical protein